MNKLKAIIFFERKWLDWAFRIILSINLLLVGFSYERIYWSFTPLCVLIGFWLYSFRVKTLSLIPLLIALYF